MGPQIKTNDMANLLKEFTKDGINVQLVENIYENNSYLKVVGKFKQWTQENLVTTSEDADSVMDYVYNTMLSLKETTGYIWDEARHKAVKGSVQD